MAYLTAATVITLIVLEGQFPIASLFKCDITYLWHIAQSLCICIELVVVISNITIKLTKMITYMYYNNFLLLKV